MIKDYYLRALKIFLISHIVFASIAAAARRLLFSSAKVQKIIGSCKFLEALEHRRRAHDFL